MPWLWRRLCMARRWLNGIAETLVPIGVSFVGIISITVLSSPVVLRWHVHGVIEAVVTLIERLIQWLRLLRIMLEVVLELTLHLPWHLRWPIVIVAWKNGILSIIIFVNPFYYLSACLHCFCWTSCWPCFSNCQVHCNCHCWAPGLRLGHSDPGHLVAGAVPRRWLPIIWEFSIQSLCELLLTLGPLEYVLGLKGSSCCMLETLALSFEDQCLFCTMLHLCD